MNKWIFKIRVKGDLGEVEISQETDGGTCHARDQILKEVIVIYRQLEEKK